MYETAYLYLRMVRRNAESNQSKRYRQMLVHVHDGIVKLLKDSMRSIKPSRAGSNHRYAKGARILSCSCEAAGCALNE
jgi:hypothetical protein